MSTGLALFGAFLLLAGNAFFVAAEFALVASKPHRLEELAQSGGAAAKSATRATRQLSLTLAGAQLGITLCSLGLGALAEPALEHLFHPAFHAVGLSDSASTVVAFLLALCIVVFLHMVAGEMAPKSWAIINPERSAVMLALPFAAFNFVAGPLLRGLNGLTNAMLAVGNIHPQNELAQAHGPNELRMLLEQSKDLGTLPAAEHRLLSRMLRLQETTVARVMAQRNQVVHVTHDAPDTHIEAISLQTGRSRIAVVDESQAIVGIVHVRDAVRSTTTTHASRARDLMTPVMSIDHATTVAAAVEQLRDHHAQVAVVTQDADQIGFVALEDLLEQIVGQFDDETDLPGTL